MPTTATTPASSTSAEERDRAEAPDDLTPGLEIDDKALKDIIRRLYYPHSPYEFSVLPADILGQVYEQFLGKVIRLTGGPQGGGRGEAGGPQGRRRLLHAHLHRGLHRQAHRREAAGRQEAGPKGGASRLKIVDPACGSGSFLIGAYQYLLDWHRDWYVEDGPEKRPQAVYTTGRRPVAPHHGREEAHPAQQHLRRGHRPPGRRGDQALAAPEGAGRRDERDDCEPARLFARARPARPRRQHQVRQLPHRPRLLRRPADELDLDEEEQYRINVFDWKDAFPQVFRATTLASTP